MEQNEQYSDINENIQVLKLDYNLENREESSEITHLSIVQQFVLRIMKFNILAARNKFLD